MGSKAEDDDGHGQKQTPTVAVHMKITDPATTAYADKGYLSWASVRVHSFTFVSLSSCSESHVFIFATCFLRFTILFVALSFVRSSRSSHIRFPTHTHIPPSQSSFPFLFPVLQILLIMIPLI